MTEADKGPLIRALENQIKAMENRIEELEDRLTNMRNHLYGSKEFDTAGKLGELTAEIRGTRQELGSQKDLLAGVIADRNEEKAMRRGADERFNFRLVLNTVATVATALGVCVTIYLAVTGGGS